jgi:hypothetical protein
MGLFIIKIFTVMLLYSLVQWIGTCVSFDWYGSVYWVGGVICAGVLFLIDRLAERIES